MKLLTAQQMQALDREAIEGLGLPGLVLMENAARAFCEVFQAAYPADAFPRVVALAGKGNNGGDAIAIGRILASRGYRVSLLVLAEPGELKSDAARQLEIYSRLNLTFQTVTRIDTLRTLLDGNRGHDGVTVTIDGLFGVGLVRPLDGFWAEAVDLINELPGPKVAIDLPSGCLDADLPDAKQIKADLTITFQEPKTALIRPQNRACAGVVQVVDIGIPTPLYAHRQDLIDWIDGSGRESLLIPRDPFAHKRSFGHGLMVAGSPNMPGAAVLALQAALSAGIGLCTASVPSDLFTTLAVSCPEALLHHRREPLDYNRYSALLFGPGIGLHDEDAALLIHIWTQYAGILILDADGLNLLARIQTAPPPMNSTLRLVMTPHAGEAARLLGQDRSWVEANRLEAVRTLAEKYRALVVLKGKYSLVADSTGRVRVNPTGNAGMAAAGSGDVLSGLLLGLLTQFQGGLPMMDMVGAAVWLHGRCGDLAMKEPGRLAVAAGELTTYLAEAMVTDDGITI